jgi:hypothetical protein
MVANINVRMRKRVALDEQWPCLCCGRMFWPKMRQNLVCQKSCAKVYDRVGYRLGMLPLTEAERE